MSTEDNKAVVGRWFTEFWGKSPNLKVIDEIAAQDMLLKYSLHEPRRGRDDIKAFMTAYEALVARVVGFVEAPHVGLDLPLDVRGTAFQQRVWRALQHVPVASRP
jgi:O6-methylguanine-DNA--protein-cysteine methyltransferase